MRPSIDSFVVARELFMSWTCVSACCDEEYQVHNTHLFGHDVIPCDAGTILDGGLHPSAVGTRGHECANAIGQEWIGFWGLSDDGRDGLHEEMTEFIRKFEQKDIV